MVAPVKSERKGWRRGRSCAGIVLMIGGEDSAVGMGAKVLLALLILLLLLLLILILILILFILLLLLATLQQSIM